MKNQHGIFLIFHMKLQQHRKKLTQMTFVWTKSYQKWSQIEVFQVLPIKINEWNFSYLLYEVTVKPLWFKIG